jgi:hypothetical protein
VLVFATLEVLEAVAHAKAGGQSLHLHRIIPDRDRAPRCFVQAVDRGEPIAHLFDLDEVRLLATAKKCGVRVLYIDRRGTDRAHIDLCSGPLRNAYRLLAEGQADRLAEILAELRAA